MPASPRLAPPRPRYRRLLSCLPTATHHSPPSSTSRHGVVHSDCLTAPAWRCSPHPAACLPPSSLSTAPERHLLATAVPHQVGHGCRRRHVFVSTVFQKLFSSVSSVCCVCCNGYIRMLQWLHTYVASICFKHFRCLRRMFHAFHLYVSCVSFDVAKGSNVAYVAMATHVCFKCMSHMFHLF